MWKKKGIFKLTTHNTRVNLVFIFKNKWKCDGQISITSTFIECHINTPTTLDTFLKRHQKQKQPTIHSWQKQRLPCPECIVSSSYSVNTCWNNNLKTMQHVKFKMLIRFVFICTAQIFINCADYFQVFPYCIFCAG